MQRASLYLFLVFALVLLVACDTELPNGQPEDGDAEADGDTPIDGDDNQPACNAGSYACQGDDIFECTAAGQWVFFISCASQGNYTCSNGLCVEVGAPDGDGPDGDMPDGDDIDGDGPDGDVPDGDGSDSDGYDGDVDMDADAVDGDATDGDADDDGYYADCVGSCNLQSTLPECMGDSLNLCACNPDTSMLTVVDCNDICIDGGFAGSDGCDYSSQSGNDVCFCYREDCQSDQECIDAGTGSYCVSMGESTFCATRCDLAACDDGDACIDLGIGDGCGACVDIDNDETCPTAGESCGDGMACHDICGLYNRNICSPTCQATPNSCTGRGELCWPLGDGQGGITDGICVNYGADCPTCGEEPPSAGPGEPCPFGPVNAGVPDCGTGMDCLGYYLNAGSQYETPCSDDSDCENVLGEFGVCAAGYCGYSFCSPRCEDAGDCTADLGDDACCRDIGSQYNCMYGEFCPAEPGMRTEGQTCTFGDFYPEVGNCVEGLHCIGLNSEITCEDDYECASYLGEELATCQDGRCGLAWCAADCSIDDDCSDVNYGDGACCAELSSSNICLLGTYCN